MVKNQVSSNLAEKDQSVIITIIIIIIIYVSHVLLGSSCINVFIPTQYRSIIRYWVQVPYHVYIM